MALMKLSGLLSGLKGKINGSYSQAAANGLFKLNVNGQYAAKKKGKRMINADARAAQFNNSILAQQWRDVSEGQKSAWQAACPNYPTLDRFGTPRIPTAYELYMRLNGTLQRYGYPTLAEPRAPRPFTAFGPLVFTYVGSTEWTLDYNGAMETDEQLILVASPWQSSGRSLQIPTLRVIGSYDSGEPFPINVFTPYTVYYSSVPTYCRIWIGCYLLNKKTGETSTTQYAYIDLIP